MRKLFGIDISTNGNTTVVYIDSISTELEAIIRNELPRVCFGKYKTDHFAGRYSYKATLVELLTRYNSKSPDIKMGMIGELLSHIILSVCFSNHRPLSPFFNMEERSIRKGFDLILYEKKANEIWLTEVKSGQLHKNKTVDETNADLLHNAKRDLSERINNNEDSIWENAITSVIVSMGGKTSANAKIIERIMKINAEIAAKRESSKNQNALIISSLFCSLSSPISFEKTEGLSLKITDEAIFSKVMVLSMQKNAYEDIEKYLNSELENA